MKRRSFTQLKKQMSSQSFNEFCKKVTKEYANSEAHFARSYFCEHYNISQSCFYKILEYATITNLISDKEFEKMRNKAIGNQGFHKGGAGLSSQVKYSEMYIQRCEYIMESYSKEGLKQIAESFANHPNISKKDFAEKYYISTKVLGLLLQKAIVTNVIDDETFEAIKRRSINNSNSDRKVVENYFKALEEKRQLDKNNN